MNPINIILLDKTMDVFIPTGNNYIEEVLGAICEKHDLDTATHVLCYENYFLPNKFRLKTLNLKEDECLKLVRDFRPAPDLSVTVTLRVKDSQISANFHPEVTLWRVVKNLVATVTLKIPFSTPILIRQGIEYIGKKDLKAVTPMSLGYSTGYLFFRFLVIENAVLSKRTGGLLGSSDSLQFELTKSFDNVGSIVHRLVSRSGPSPEPKGKESEFTFHPGIARRNSSIFGEINYLGDRNAVACRRPQQKMSDDERRCMDKFYDMHVLDVKTMFKLVYDKRKELEERFIKQQNGVEKEEKNITVIRIQFPDKTVLQGLFNPDDKVKVVAKFVNLYRRVERKYQLRPPKEVLHSGKTLAEYGLVPTGKMFYKVSGEDQPLNTAFLKETVLRQLSSHEAACYAAALCHKMQNKSEIAHSEEEEISTKSHAEVKDFQVKPYRSRRSHFKY